MKLYELQPPSTRRSKREPSASPASGGVFLARFNGFDHEGRFLITRDGETEPIPALSTTGLTDSDRGAEVAISFIDNDIQRPIVVGRIQSTPAARQNLSADIDGERVVLHAEREIVLRCGEASITLTRAGKVIIKGNYVLTRSTGANKIKGAFVDIN